MKQQRTFLSFYFFLLHHIFHDSKGGRREEVREDKKVENKGQEKEDRWGKTGWGGEERKGGIDETEGMRGEEEETEKI